METPQERGMAKIYKSIEHNLLGALLGGSQIKLISLKFERGSIYWLGQMWIHLRKKMDFFLSRDNDKESVIFLQPGATVKFHILYHGLIYL